MPSPRLHYSDEVAEMPTGALVRVLLEYRKAARMLAYHTGGGVEPAREAVLERIDVLEAELVGRGMELPHPVGPDV